MKLAIIGGTGLIGSKVVALLRAQGHDAVAASPGTGVNTLTGEGLAEVLDGAAVVVDVSNSPSFEDSAVMNFFETSTTNVLAAAAKAGVGHYVALSVVGTHRLPASGYFRAKAVQEKLIADSGLPYTIVQATQFFEFLGAIADSATDGSTVRLSSARIQPIAAADVAAVVAEVALAAPVKGTVEIAGPERFQLDELVRTVLAAQGDPREVVTDPAGGYFGAPLDELTLVPEGDARLGTTRLFPTR